ncbi:hypothetical protein E4J66_06170 [Actinomyces viscosus]|uniref:Alpha/beta hydrolase family n=1 Tax=Actinomyces viscosus TaxID=1656 RepID=A0A3S4V475_ACTVI|nr:hypothetical protein [Actinomyces viscosus]TFH52849.1 hypothetical protein E4J66_06170 [Actinomyces viscosus]VEI18401.1 Uncharacterised protein [Actinomyces viscosus]
MASLLLAGCASRGPQQAAVHPTPPSHLRSRGASVAPSLRPTSGDLSVPAAFSYTDTDDETSDCIFYAAADVPVGLVVYLDGDGQPFHSQGGQSRSARSRGGLAGAGGVVEAAGARGYDVVSVRSPGDEGIWWLDDQDEKVRYLEEALEYVVAECGASTERVWLVGYSGGSEFISQWFFPAYAERMAGGGFLLFGGGEAPESATATFSDDVKGRLFLNWVTGTRDVPGDGVDGFDGIERARNSLSYYRSAGFSHTWSEWPDDDHGSITEKFGRYLGRVLDAAKEGG